MRGKVVPSLITLFTLAAGFLLTVSAMAPGQAPGVRPPEVAGAFYPADPKELGQMVDEFLAKASVPQIDGALVALISPHAGYPFSGQVAAHAYALLKGKKYDRVVVIAPSHYDAFPFASIYDGDAYSTPLGTVPVDKAFSAKLASQSPLIKISDRGHGVVEGHGEHALEDELPFLQRVLGQFNLVPIVMGDQSYEASRAVGVSLAKLLGSRKEGSPSISNTLIVVSSDLSHYHPYDEAVKIDSQTLGAIQDWDYLSLSRNFQARVWEACGGGPIVAAMIAAERLGANRALLLKYANSGDVTGDKSRVVGYSAFALIVGKPAHDRKGAEIMLNPRERADLLAIARRSVEVAVTQHKLYDLPGGSGAGPESFRQARGAFVTLKENGELRGCIGYITPLKSLVETVRDVAAFAAVEDRRFEPVSQAELGLLEYEISVLSPLRRVTDVQEIKVGRDGLLIKRGETEGVLLPQVPTEQHWDRPTFLEQVCLKAGLPTSAWQDDDSDLFMFSALVFGEHSGLRALTTDEPDFPRPRNRQGPTWPGSSPP